MLIAVLKHLNDNRLWGVGAQLGKEIGELLIEFGVNDTPTDGHDSADIGMLCLSVQSRSQFQ